MNRHANFAAPIVIRKRVFQDLLRVLHHANQLPHVLTGDALGTVVELFLDVPRIDFARIDGNRLSLELLGWGALTLPTSGGEVRQVLFKAKVLMTPSITLRGSSLMSRSTPRMRASRRCRSTHSRAAPIPPPDSSS
jgi:hypothetical protein